MTSNQILVGNIRRLCKERKLSVSELERALGFSAGLISRWTRMSPSLDQVLQVAGYLDVSLDTLTDDVSADDRNHGSDDRFIKVLKKITEDETSTIKWERVDGHACIEEIVGSEDIEDHELYECCYEEGSFLLLKVNDGDIRLYILPEQDGVPVKEQGGAEELEALWYAVETVYREKISLERANALKQRFMRDFG